MKHLPQWLVSKAWPPVVVLKSGSLITSSMNVFMAEEDVGGGLVGGSYITASSSLALLLLAAVR